MKKAAILASLVFLIIISGCRSKEVEPKIKDDLSIYDPETLDTLYELNLTIIDKEHDQLTKGEFTFDQLNTEDGRYRGDDIEVSGLLKETRNGKSFKGGFGYGLTQANCIVQQRGQSARLSPLKSYEIDLIKGSNLWHDQEVINLNKHSFDSVLIRNKLCFDLFKSVDNMLSLDSKFVNLKIKDLNKGDSFKDYGLFTHIEEMNNDYFKRRNFFSNYELYKANNFEFKRYPNFIKRKEDPSYDKGDFEEKLDIEKDSDHHSIISLIEDINNPMIPINETINKKMNRKNYITWLATNILLGNVDSASGNYYLFSPEECDRWYFIPWDYDKSLGAYSNDASKWKIGLANFWGSSLHRRFLKNDKNRQELTDRINQLHNNVFNEEEINNLIDGYDPILNEVLSKSPDKENFRSYEQVIEELRTIPEIIDNNKRLYYKTLEMPLPFFLGTVENHKTYLSFNWDSSYDFQGEDLTYNLKISKNPDMDKIFFEKDNIKDTEFILKDFPKGRFYWKVEVTDEQGLTQESFDYYVDPETGYYYHGISTVFIE